MKEKKYELVPISKKDFEELSPRLTFYHPIIEEFLSGNHDIMEVKISTAKPQTVYQSLKSHSQRLGYPFLVRKRQGRIFILKVKPKE